MSLTRENIDIVEDMPNIVKDSISNVCAQHKPSNMWPHFEKIFNETTSIADRTKCLYCGKMLVYNAMNETSSMRKHLSNCKKCPSNVDRSQALISSFKIINEEGEESSTINTWKFNQEVSRQLLAEMVIIMEEPFRMVEQPPFRKFLNSLQLLWSNISHITLAKDVVKRFDSKKVLLKSNLRSLKSRIALTTDICVGGGVL